MNRHIKKFQDKNNNEIKSTILLSAFPGTGKSHLFKNNKNLKILDSDSSTFDKKDFPENYIKHIKENIGVVDIICISSHEEVRKALVDNGLMFLLVYPNIELKDEYIERYETRGNDKGFIELLTDKWDEWITDVSEQKNCIRIELGKNEFIGDKL